MSDRSGRGCQFLSDASPNRSFAGVKGGKSAVIDQGGMGERGFAAGAI